MYEIYTQSAKHACHSCNHDVNIPLCCSAEKKSLNRYITYAVFFIDGRWNISLQNEWCLSPRTSS